MEKLNPGRNNEEARMNFVKYWAKFVRINTDQKWGKQHTAFINSMMQNANNYPFSPKTYLELKGEKHTR